MSDLKCRYCGGNIADLGDGTGKCESCGSLLVLPKSNEKVNNDLYNRADHLRKIHDYDGAISAYEHLAAENPTDPEARWSLVLCRYGVEYTYDRRTESYLPTINRMSLDSILEDRDYIKALEYADEAAKAEYRSQALKLAAIQDELEKIVRENEHYDVFISFKATDDNRKRTRDYTLAQEIYDALSANGLRVFFSPVSLRNHVGEVYEPYIFAALYSAKVMVLVGTKREYLDSEWVRNEWSRYLFMTRENPKKHILPVCEGMKPEEFPAGIGKMQAISMNVVGALEMIRERVTSYTTGQEKRIFVKTAAGEEMDLTNQLRRLRFAVEDGDFDEADDWVRKLRGELTEKHPEVEYTALFAKYKARNEAELAAHIDTLTEDEDYHWLLQNGNEEQKTQLSQLEEQQIKVLQREYEQELLNLLFTLYKDGNYKEIVDTVEEERKSTVFDRDDEIDDLYRRAKQKYEAEEQLLRYRELIGDGTTYFEEQLKKKNPEIVEKLPSLNEDIPNVDGFDRFIGLSWIPCLVIIIAWSFLKSRLAVFVVIFDIVLYLLYLLQYFGEYDERPDEQGHGPKILLKTVLTCVVTMVLANFWMGLGPFCEIFGWIFGDKSSDDGLLIYICLVAMFMMILWSFHVRNLNKTRAANDTRRNEDKKELLEFLKQFEVQEELLLLEEFDRIEERDRIPLESFYKQITNG